MGNQKIATLPQLDLRYRALEARLAAGALSPRERAAALEASEALTLQIAATPARGARDLHVKLRHLAAALHPTDEPLADDSIESILLKAVLTDAQRLARD